MTFVIQTPVSHPSETGPAIQASISDITCHQLHSFIYYMYICQRKKTYIMNKIIFILFISMFCLSACKEKGEQFDVKGHITSAKDKTLYFEAMTLNGTLPIDSVKLDDKGQFEFSHKRPACPEFFRLRIERQIINIAIDSTEQIQIEAEFPTMSTNYTIKGSENSEVIREISLKQNAVQAKIDQIAQNKQITVGEQDRLIKQAVLQYKEDLKKNYIVKDPGSSYAYFAVFQTLGRMLVFDPVNDHEDVRYVAAVATAWNERYNGTERAENLYNIAIQGLKNTQTPQTVEINPENLKNIEVREAGFIDIELPDIRGHYRKLSDIQNKVIMLDFTAYSIPQSQERTLQLRTLYQKYASKGFEIYQISIDPDEHYWKTVTESLPWICVYEKEHTASDYLALYQVRNIPTYFLIDREGNVVARSENIPNIGKAIETLL